MKNHINLHNNSLSYRKFLRILKVRSEIMRKNPTAAEKFLWEKIKDRQLGLFFRNQFIISPFIVDFYCPQAKLMIEVDGKNHLRKDQHEKDIYRSHIIYHRFKIKTLRFTNEEVLNNIDNVLENIKIALKNDLNQISLDKIKYGKISAITNFIYPFLKNIPNYKVYKEIIIDNKKILLYAPASQSVFDIVFENNDLDKKINNLSKSLFFFGYKESDIVNFPNKVANDFHQQIKKRAFSNYQQKIINNFELREI